MSVFLSKLFSLLLHPLVLGLLVGAAGWALTWRWARAGQAIAALGVAIIVIPALPITADWMQHRLERLYPPVASTELPEADVIVVLGGGVSPAVPPRVYPHLNTAADRVLHAARLYQAERAPRLLVSGGTLPWHTDTPPEAHAMRNLLVQWGVPEEDIWMEPESATTYENARHTADLIREHDMERVLLVTSALHMHRALAVFCSANVPAVPAAIDYHITDGPRSVFDVVPSAEALARSTGAIHEYVGYVVYRLRGWIDPDRVPVTVPPSLDDHACAI